MLDVWGAYLVTSQGMALQAAAKQHSALSCHHSATATEHLQQDAFHVDVNEVLRLATSRACLVCGGGMQLVCKQRQ